MYMGENRRNTYDILMGIHEYVETVFFRYPQDLNCVLNPLLVIPPGPGSLDRLPGKDIADGVVPEAFQAGEMDVCIFFSEGSVVEFDVVAVEKVVSHMRRHIGLARELGIACDVDAPEQDVSTMGVLKLAILDG